MERGAFWEMCSQIRARGRAERSAGSFSKRRTVTGLTSHLRICQPCPDGSQVCTSKPEAKLTPTLTADVGTGLPNRALKLNWPHPGSSPGLPPSQYCQQHLLGCSNLGAILLSLFFSPLATNTAPAHRMPSDSPASLCAPPPATESFLPGQRLPFSPAPGATLIEYPLIAPWLASSPYSASLALLLASPGSASSIMGPMAQSASM